jgi:hypothetical protein
MYYRSVVLKSVGQRARSVMISSVIPSASRAVASSPPRLSNGSTAIAGLSPLGAGSPDQKCHELLAD